MSETATEPATVPNAAGEPVSVPTTSDAPSPAPEAKDLDVKREPDPKTVALATFEDLSGKAKRLDDFVLSLPQGDGTVKQVRLELAAVTGPDYDTLIEKCPPTREQQQRGMSFNPKTFEPLLISQVVTSPKLTSEQWASLRDGDNWSGGEWASLAVKCQALCMEGLDIPFSGRASR